MEISYNSLFSIQLLHEYFSDRTNVDLEIVPAADCAAILKGMNVLWRNLGNRFIALIRENAVHEPFVNTILANGSPSKKMYRENYGQTVLRFYLKVKNPLFFNYTNTGFSSAPKKISYFSNRAANYRNGILYLSVPVPQHATGKEYVPGNIVMEPGTDNVFEAIAKHNSTGVAELTNTLLWVPKGLRHLSAPLEDFINNVFYTSGELVLEPGTNNVFESLIEHTSTNATDLGNPFLWVPRGEGQLQYPTENDLVEYSTGIYPFTLSVPATEASTSVFSFNYSELTPAYDVPVGNVVTQNFPAPQSTINVSLSALRSGKYEIRVNGETKTIYYDPHLGGGNIFGIIEIFNYLTAANDYSLLTVDEKIINIAYTLQFPTRRVLWKYIRRGASAQSITDTGSTGYVFPLHANDFVSATPIPLSEAVLETLELDATAYILHPLPNPPIQRFGKFTQNGYDYLCCEMYLNY